MYAVQHTVKSEVVFCGIGLHSGAGVVMRVHPAPENTGIVFFRTDLGEGENVIPARWDHVIDTRMCTVIGTSPEVSVGTVEHLMAALAGVGVDNAYIEIDGPEVPIMDGSSEPFVRVLRRVGLTAQDAPRKAIRILEMVSVEEGGKWVSLSPSDVTTFSSEIEFAHPSIGRQTYATTLVNGNFAHELANCRTFGFVEEVFALRRMGLALGGSLENSIVLDQSQVLNNEGLRRPDEFVRHKVLDAVGDMYLAGAPILGAYQGLRSGHALNNTLLRKLFATEGAYEWVNLPEGTLPLMSTASHGMGAVAV